MLSWVSEILHSVWMSHPVAFGRIGMEADSLAREVCVARGQEIAMLSWVSENSRFVETVRFHAI